MQASPELVGLSVWPPFSPTVPSTSLTWGNGLPGLLCMWGTCTWKERSVREWARSGSVGWRPSELTGAPRTGPVLWGCLWRGVPSRGLSPPSGNKDPVFCSQSVQVSSCGWGVCEGVLCWWGMEGPPGVRAELASLCPASKVPSVKKKKQAAQMGHSC